MRSRRRVLIPSQAVAYCIQVQAAVFGELYRAADALAGERWHHDSALLRLQHNRAAGWEMIGSDHSW